jgi:hypothetical protein
MEQPSIFTRFFNWLRRLFNPEPAPEHEPAPSAPPTVDEYPAPVVRRVSLVIYNPNIPGAEQRRLTNVMGWNDPDRLVNELIEDLRDISHGYANFKIAERIEVDAFPRKQDGFRYTPEEFLNCWKTGHGFHQPDAVDYDDILFQNVLVPKIQTGEIDEIWTFSFPYAGFYESRMAGPGAFWCNAPPLDSAMAAGRRFVIMAFNYERGTGEMLESFGHRAESIMTQVFRDIPDGENLWKRFTLYDKIAPGQAEVGTVHFAPNSLRDYDWGNPTNVPSRSRNWQNFPDLSGNPVMMNCREWGNGNIRDHHCWWFSLMPHHNGQYRGISFNWWKYIVDPNQVP